MRFQELMCLYKLMTVAFNPNSNVRLNQNELEIASEVLKEIADDAPNWTHKEKEQYKLLVDLTKESTKNNYKETV
ncbi:MAG: hypothetical protein E7390_05380 [Ruminococcaceae bacterium]|nr:hypothetical protein [Oscillospiraceae bacterium]